MKVWAKNSHGAEQPPQINNDRETGMWPSISQRFQQALSDSFRKALSALCAALLLIASAAFAEEPPTIQPFKRLAAKRDDAVPGAVELSNGVIRTGQLYLTRDKRLKIYDETARRQREIPWTSIERIDCEVKSEWMEKEWKFKETTSDEKIYTGRAYPAREYVHTVVLRGGQSITGSVSAIVYLETSPDQEPESFLLNKRNKGEPGQTLKSLLYVKQIKLGKEAFEEGEKKDAKDEASKTRRLGDEETGSRAK